VVTLNRAVAVAKVRGPTAALSMIEPLAGPLAGYFNFFGVKGWLLMQLGRAEEARIAFGRAIALDHTAAEAAHINWNTLGTTMGMKSGLVAQHFPFAA
jgi:RNA polymerase sigma-70 factor (ECF subfamily)